MRRGIAASEFTRSLRIDAALRDSVRLLRGAIRHPAYTQTGGERLEQEKRILSFVGDDVAAAAKRLGILWCCCCRSQTTKIVKRGNRERCQTCWDKADEVNKRLKMGKGRK